MPIQIATSQTREALLSVVGTALAGDDKLRWLYEPRRHLRVLWKNVRACR
jgi:hypothetical protein